MSFFLRRLVWFRRQRSIKLSTSLTEDRSSMSELVRILRREDAIYLQQMTSQPAPAAQSHHAPW